MAILTMSEREISRLDIIQRVVEKRLRQRQAAQLLEMSTRQVQRLVQAYRCQGALGLISQRRGRPSRAIARKITYITASYPDAACPALI